MQAAAMIDGGMNHTEMSDADAMAIARHELSVLFYELWGLETDDEIDWWRRYKLEEFRGHGQVRAAISQTLHRLLSAPDADLSELVMDYWLVYEPGVHARLRRILAMVAPGFGVYPHVRERDVVAMRRWLDEVRPISELRELVLVELADLNPAQREDVATLAFKHDPNIAGLPFRVLVSGVGMLASGELSAEMFEKRVEAAAAVVRLCARDL
jgi:hypothetical protein